MIDCKKIKVASCYLFQCNIFCSYYLTTWQSVPSKYILHCQMCICCINKSVFLLELWISKRLLNVECHRLWQSSSLPTIWTSNILDKLQNRSFLYSSVWYSCTTYGERTYTVELKTDVQGWYQSNVSQSPLTWESTDSLLNLNESNQYKWSMSVKSQDQTYHIPEQTWLYISPRKKDW